MEDVIFRPFQMSDYSALVQCWTESGLELRPGDDQESIKRKLARDPQLFLVAVYNEKIIGSVIGAFDGRRGWIYHLAVLPEFRNKSIGTHLVKKVEKELDDLNCPFVYLMVDPGNTNAIRLYNKMNYAMVDYQLMGKVIRS